MIGGRSMALEAEHHPMDLLAVVDFLPLRLRLRRLRRRRSWRRLSLFRGGVDLGELQVRHPVLDRLNLITRPGLAAERRP